MEYPQDFSREACARVEAVRLRATREYEQTRDRLQSGYGHFSENVENLRTFILRVFKAFAHEACTLGENGLWTVDRIRSEADEFLRRFTIEAYYDYGHDRGGMKLPEMISDWGNLRSDVERDFRKTAEWRDYQDQLLTVAERIANRPAARRNPQHTGTSKSMSHVFISYVREDSSLVDRLERDLKSRGIQVWLDRNSIAPGKLWNRAIRDAIQTGAFFLACFSGNSTSRSRTYMNEEITLAIEELRLRPSDRGWFIPVLLSDCTVPPRDIGAGITLGAIQQVRLYENWGAGITKIVSAIKADDLASDDDESEPEDDDLDETVEPFHESALLRAGQHHFHAFDLEGDDEMIATVEADNYVDMLICAERDYKRWIKRNREDELPAYFDDAEEVRKCTLRLVAPTAGTYGVLVINQGEEDVDVSIEIEFR